MEIETNITFEEKQENIMKIANNYLININVFLQKINLFHQILQLLKSSYITSNLNPPFDSMNKILINFSNQLIPIIENMENTILFVLNKIISDLQNNIQESSKVFSKIKNYELEEIEIKNKKNFNETEINKENKSKLVLIEKDYNSFNHAVKENDIQLSKYEIDSVKEIIEEEKIKYDNIYNEMSSCINDYTQINSIISMFSRSIKAFSENLDYLSTNIDQEMDKKNKKEESILSKNIIGLQKIISTKKKEKYLNVSFNFDENKEIDFEKNITKIIDSIINANNPIMSKEIINIFNFLGININSKKKPNCIKIFLDKISELCENNIISVKNKNNFIHLTNILNTILLQDKSNANISYEIITISNKIKYRNIFLYKILQEKNIYLKTMTFWKDIIKAHFINKINEFIEDNINEKTDENEKSKKEKEKEKDKGKEKDQLKNLIKKLSIEKEISKNIKKLNYNQIKELLKYIEQIAIAKLSSLIPYMIPFLVTDLKINSIIEKYKEIFGFNDSIKNYLENLILIHRLKIQHNKYSDSQRKEILILSASRFLPKNEYRSLFPLDKNLYPNLKKGIFNNIFIQKDLSIELHIKYLSEYLSINKTKKSYSYTDLKQKINNSFFENNKNDQNIKKTKELIKNDLNRTKFIQENKNHRESIESILFSFYFNLNKVKYYQGLNLVICYLYQLVNYEEEKTFDFFYALQFHTNYHLLFEDNFKFLNILFSVFEKIIKMKIPEFFYIMKNVGIDTNYFCSSWFITLFAGNLDIIDVKNPPLLEIYFIEKFCLYGWRAIFILGIVILEFCFEKAKSLEKEDLIKYIMKLIPEEKIFDNENFEKIKNLYEKNEKFITNTFVDKLIEVTQFEYKNEFLLNSEEC